MRFGISLAAIGSAAALVIPALLIGCTVHPTPLGFGYSDANNADKHVNEFRYFSDLTVPIVRQIRCEARDVMIRRAAALITFSDELAKAKQLGGTDLANANLARERAIARVITDTPDMAKTFAPWDVDPHIYVQYAPFMNATIGYSFDLTVEENNVNGVDPRLNPTGGDHSLTLNIANHSIDAKRRNKRTFKISDIGLASYQRLSCPQDTVKLPVTNFVDWAYPMRGKIGFERTFRAFEGMIFANTTPLLRAKWARAALVDGYESTFGLQIASTDAFSRVQEMADECDPDKSSDCTHYRACYSSLISNSFKHYNSFLYAPPSKAAKLAALGYKPGELSHQGPAPQSGTLLISDKLTFTTLISGGLTPSITFNGASGSLKMNMLGLTFTGSRKDVHDVDIQITAPKKRSTPKVPVPLFTTASGYKFLIEPPNAKAASQTIEVSAACQVTLEAASKDEKEKTIKVPPDRKAQKADKPVVIMATETERPVQPFAESPTGLLISSEFADPERAEIQQELEEDREDRRLIEIDERLRAIPF